MSLVERIAPNGVGPMQKFIIDRYVAAVYQETEQFGIVPILTTLREKLLEQPEEKAKGIALSLELFTTDSLDIFGHKSTVDLDKRVVVFDIHGLGEQLKPIGPPVITDTMLNRVTLNWKRASAPTSFYLRSLLYLIPSRFGGRLSVQPISEVGILKSFKENQ